TKWFQLFEQLRVIVIDELHTYRGVFGSHVANVIRRLLRLCAYYGSHPIIVCCSATIANPLELATTLTGRPAVLVDQNDAPRGPRGGETLGVAATSAVELGLDIGRLDVSILAGYPGSVAATWQQIGRAGRRGETSVGILVASGAPVDRYVVHHPEFLLDGRSE